MIYSSLSFASRMCHFVAFKYDCCTGRAAWSRDNGESASHLDTMCGLDEPQLIAKVLYLTKFQIEASYICQRECHSVSLQNGKNFHISLSMGMKCFLLRGSFARCKRQQFLMHVCFVCEWLYVFTYFCARQAWIFLLFCKFAVLIRVNER